MIWKYNELSKAYPNSPEIEKIFQFGYEQAQWRLLMALYEETGDNGMISGKVIKDKLEQLKEDSK